jgi:hypothetical protein
VNVLTIYNYVTHIDPNAKLNPLCLVSSSVLFSYLPLDIQCTAHCIYGAPELNQLPIAHCLHNAPSMLADFWVNNGPA